jgi:cytochrome c oxidase assembly factor CtaG
MVRMLVRSAAAPGSCERTAGSVRSVLMLALANPPPLTLTRVFTAWQLEPGVLVVAAVLAGAYGWGLRRRARLAGSSLGRWPVGRTASFLAGVATILLLGCSFLGVYDDALFWVRAVQNTVLLMITPMLIALGAPIRLIADVLPPGMRAPLSRALHSRAAQVLTFPLVVTVVLVVPLLVLYLSPLYELTLPSGVASGIAGTVVAFTGFIYYWSRFRVDPTPRTDSYLVTLWITVVEMIGDAVLGVVLWLGPLVAAAWYAAQANGVDPRIDQTIGAGILWIGGDIIGLPFILIVVNRMSREDDDRARVIDAELDAAEEAAAEEHETAATPSRLWWENDPQLAERFRRR